MRRFSTLSRRLQRVVPASSGPTTSASPSPALYTGLEPKIKESQDSLIRAVFDNGDVWQDFSQKSVAKPKQSRSITGFINYLTKESDYETGLFMNDFLKTPAGFQKYTAASIEEAGRLIQQLLGALTQRSKLRNAITTFDRLSDVLCQVIDLAEFIRAAHPEQHFVQAAQEAHEQMYEYMNVLNTSVELYTVLDMVFKDVEIVNQLTHEEKVVGKLLLEDFKKSGVTLDDSGRENFVSLTTKISLLGRDFISSNHPKEDYITLTQSEAQGLDPQLAQQLSRGNSVYVPTGGVPGQLALRGMKSETSRKMLWSKMRESSDKSISSLEDLLVSRLELANLMGKESYADYLLSDKMAGNPENVMRFLNGLLDKTLPGAKKELSVLEQIKRQASGNTAGILQAWDKSYYASQLLYQKRNKTKTAHMLSEYFSVGTVVQGLSRIFDKIYGIRFVPTETKTGETWHHDVRRLDVVSESEGLIGIMYADLFQREGKSPNPAHFTVRCSREIYPDELAHMGSSPISKVPTLDIDGKVFQIPTIALICDFTTPHDLYPSLLSYQEVETLFHEMGHAIHSMLGRTSLHNVCGTRCATDFVELPSVFMENFASNPESLALFARHYSSDSPLPYQQLERHLNEQSYFKDVEQYTQIKMAMLDQVLHGNIAEGIKSGRFNSQKLYDDLENDRPLFPPSPSSWHGSFGHLFGYGASYYCYLLDRQMADIVWKKLFAKNPLSREAGSKMKNEVLQWGGSRDPWECIAGVLEDPELAKGGSQAMEKIGNYDKH